MFEAQVPREAIREDLSRTGSAETTIEHILSGQIEIVEFYFNFCFGFFVKLRYFNFYKPVNNSHLPRQRLHQRRMNFCPHPLQHS